MQIIMYQTYVYRNIGQELPLIPLGRASLKGINANNRGSYQSNQIIMRKTHEISSYHISFSFGSSGTVHEGLFVHHKNPKHALFESKTTRLSQFLPRIFTKDSQKTCGESVLRYGLRYDKQSASLLLLCMDDLIEIKGNNLVFDCWYSIRLSLN